jgi:rhodanese-related sulfurtransferase
MADSKAAFFVDTRSVVNFGKGHVPGASAIPYKSASDGPAGWKSYKASVWAIKAGYKNVNYMRGGWTD